MFSSLTPARTHLALKLLAILVLIAGFGGAASIWCAQDRTERQLSATRTNNLDVANSAEPLPPDDSRRYTHDVELYYGKTGLLMDKWTRRLKSLTQGKPLAGTIAVASVVVAAGCFFFAAIYRPEHYG